MDQHSKPLWLVKCGAKILGPCSAEEIIAQILAQQLSPLDEAKQPGSRWLLIRQHPELMELLSQKKMEFTSTATLASFTRTDTEQKNPPSEDPDDSDEPQTILQSDLKDIQATVVGRGKLSGGVYSLEKQKVPIFKFLLIAMVVLGAGFYLQSWLNNQKQQKEFAKVKSQILRWKALGLYEKSLETYKKLSPDEKTDTELLNSMAPLLALNENQIQLVPQVIEPQWTKYGSLESGLVLALINLQNANLDIAEKIYLQAANQQSRDKRAWINLALLSLRKGRAQEALEKFAQAEKISGSHPLITLGRAYSKWILHQVEATQFIAELDQLRKQAFPWSFEFDLLEISTISDSTDSESIEKSLTRFIKNQPRASNKLVKEIGLDWAFFDGSAFQALCDKMGEFKANSGLKGMAKSLCYLGFNRDNEAKNFAVTAIAEQPQNETIKYGFLVYLTLTGKKVEALSILKESEKNHEITFQNPESLLLLGDLCLEQNNFECAQKNFLALDEYQIPKAKAGLAEIQLSRGNSKAALEYIRQGLQRSPDDLQLIEIREKWETNL